MIVLRPFYPVGISCLGVFQVWTHIMTGLDSSCTPGTEFRSSCFIQMVCLMDAKLDRSLSLVLGRFSHESPLSLADTGLWRSRAVEAIFVTSMLLCQLLFQIQSVYQSGCFCVFQLHFCCSSYRNPKFYLTRQNKCPLLPRQITGFSKVCSS